MRFLRILAIAVLIPGVAGAESSKELLRQLKAVLKEEAEAKKGDAKSPGVSGMETSRLVPQIEAVLLRGNGQAEEALIGISGYTSSEKAQEIIASLIEIVRQERKEKEAARDAQVNTAVENAAKVILSAKSPKEIDPIIQTLSGLVGQNDYGNSPESRKSQEKVREALQFVNKWQDYLFQKEAGNDEAARQAMRELSSRSMEFPLIPRSEILARTQGDGAPLPSATEERAREIQAVLEKIKSLDDLDAAIRKLRGMKTDNSSPDMQVVSALTAIQRNYLEFQNGLSTSIDLGAPFGPELPELIPLRAHLVLLVLPRYLGISDTPKAGETPYDFLLRITKEAKARNDWIVYARAADALRIISSKGNMGGNSLTQLDTTALTSFLTGLNQEKAEQYALAVTSYRNALRGTGDYIPVEYIGERLKAIEKDHPEAMSQAQQQNAGAGRYPFDPRQGMGMPPNMVPRQQPPGSAPPPATPLPEELKVPPSPSPSEKKSKPQ